MAKIVFDWFKGFNTINGLGHIYGSTERQWKAFWTLLTFGFLIVTGYSAFLIVMEFFKYDVVTNFSVDHKDRLVIPSVTICNANRVHCGNLMKKIEDYDKANETRNEMLCKLFKLTGCDVSVQVYENMDNGEITSNLSICNVSEYNYTYIDTLHEYLNQDEISQAFLEIYFKLNRTELSDLAHTPTDTIKKCSMGPITVTDECLKTMSGENATRIITPRYGVCYLHNFEPLNSSKHSEASGSSGPDYGLNLILDIQSDNYMRYGLSQFTGMILTLNDPNTMPMVLAKPIFLTPNTHAAIKVFKKVIMRQKSPYVTDCSDTYPQKYQSHVNFTSVKYSNDFCKAKCKVDFVHKVCGCFDPLLMEAIFLSQMDVHKNNFCSVVTNSTQRNCASNAIDEYSWGEGGADQCPCKTDCYKSSYDVRPNFNIFTLHSFSTGYFQYTLSETQWPSDQNLLMLAQQFGIKYNGYKVTYKEQQEIELHGEDAQEGYLDEFKDKVQNNFMQVVIYYGSLDVEAVSEEPEYTFLTFLSGLGGALSLYLGISFIQVFEVVEFVVKLFASFAQNVRK